MLPTSFTTCLIATAIPESIRLHAVVDLLHDHRQHMNLDSHLETKTRLAAHVITFHSADSDADLFIPDGLDRWLVSATEDIVAGLEVEENQIPDKGWSVEYWSVEIAHPMGKSFGKLRYV